MDFGITIKPGSFVAQASAGALTIATPVLYRSSVTDEAV
jgi:hypothetical protein